jgi:signal transduction histidine kinase
MMEDVDVPREAQLDFLQGIDEEADKLEAIVANLLSLSRMESGRLYLNRHPADVGQLIRELVATMDVQAPRHRLVCDLPHEPLMATMDARSIEEVMRNLVDNALKYSPEGGTITIHSRRDETQVLVSVSDEGIGIQPEDLERVFERFYRVDNKVGRSAGGVGLGLAVCRSIVEAHGGRIWVESTLGEGSTFLFTLPVAVPDREGGEPSAP